MKKYKGLHEKEVNALIKLLKHDNFEDIFDKTITFLSDEDVNNDILSCFSTNEIVNILDERSELCVAAEAYLGELDLHQLISNKCKDISQKKEVIYNIIGTTSLWDMEGQIESFVELLNKR